MKIVLRKHKGSKIPSRYGLHRLLTNKMDVLAQDLSKTTLAFCMEVLIYLYECTLKRCHYLQRIITHVWTCLRMSEHILLCFNMFGHVNIFLR
jgi:hypothetical protein